MGLSNRTANDDTAIRRGPLDENIEVSKPGRYYPEEYNDQISIVSQANVLKGEIPKSLASIVEHYDDFKISTWANDEDTETYKYSVDKKYENAMYQEQLQLDMLNQNYDRFKRLQSDIDKAIEFANNTEGAKVEEEVGKVLLDYKNPEEIANAPAALRQWQQTYETYAIEALSKARGDDYQNAHAQAEANMQDIINNATNLVISGRVANPAEGMKQLLPRLLEYKGVMPYQKWSRACNDAFSKLVHMSAIRIQDMFQKGQFQGGAEEAIQALNNLCINYRQMTLDVTDKQGNVSQMTFTLDMQTQQECWKIFNDAKSGGDPSDSILTTTVSDWETQVGWKEVAKGKLDNNIPNFNADALDNITNTTLDDILKSNASASSKANKAKEIYEKAAVIRAQLSIGELYLHFGEKTGVTLQQSLNKLNRDLKNDTDFTNYNLEIPTGTGNPIIVGSAGFLSKLPQFGDGGLATREYWINYRDTLQKMVTTLNNSAPHNIVAEIDSDLSAISKNIPNLISVNSLVSKSGANVSINQQGVMNLSQELNNYRRNSSKYNMVVPLSDNTIGNMVEAIESSGATIQEQQCMYRAVAAALSDSNYLTDIIGYAERTKDGKASKFITALAQTDNSEASKTLMNTMSILYSDPQELKIANDKLNSNSQLNELTIGSVLTSGGPTANLNISSNEAPLFSDMLTQVKLIAAYTQPASKQKAYCESMMRKLIDPMYVSKNTINGIPMSRPFKYSPQMSMYKGQAGEQRMANVFRSAVNELNIQKTNGRIPNNYNISIYSDNKTGSFYYTVNGKRIATSIPGARSQYIGQHLENETTKRYSPNQVGMANALKFISDLGTSDKIFRQKFMTNSYNLTTDEMKKAHPSKLQMIKGGSTSRTYNQVVNSNDAAVQKDFAALSAWWNNSDNFVKAVQAPSNKNVNGSIQNMHGEASRIMSKGQATTYTRGGVSNNASTIQDESSRRNKILTTVDRGAEAKSHILGFAANISDMDIIENFAESNMTHASKINQDGISIPITHAAVGNEDYIDAFNSAMEFGFDITDAYIPNVTMDYYSPERESDILEQGKYGKLIGTATGFAADTTKGASLVKDGFDGTKDKAPISKGKTYTRNEIQDLVDYYADMWQIPRRLAHAMIGQESGYQQRVTSNKGAHGLAQIMPETAKSLGVTDRSDAAQSAWGGCKYLAQNFRSFGSWPLALAAYNAGPGRVKAAGGIPNIKETQNYVKNIMAKAGMSYGGNYSVSFELNDKNLKFIDKDTNRLSDKGMNNLMYLVEQGAGYKDKVECIYTNRPELLSNDSQYKDFAKYRNKKGTDGKPLFRKGNVNGFQVKIKSDGLSSVSLNPASIPAIADSVATRQCETLPANNRDSIEALITTFSDRYNKQHQMSDKIGSALFGLAGLSVDDYNSYGVPLSVCANPEMQARVLNQEFQRAKNILGSERKAVFALAGGDLRDSNGIIKSWAEVKQDKEAFMKDWFIQPSEDATRRDKINTLVSNYDKLYNNIRGIA